MTMSATARRSATAWPGTSTRSIRFLNAVEAAGPARKLVHVVLDNYGIHKRPRIMA